MVAEVDALILFNGLCDGWRRVGIEEEDFDILLLLINHIFNILRFDFFFNLRYFETLARSHVHERSVARAALDGLARKVKEVIPRFKLRRLR